MIPNIQVTQISGERKFLALELAGLARETSAWMEFAYWHAPSNGAGWPPEEGMCCGLIGRLFRLFSRIGLAIEQGDSEAADIFARCAFESCSDLSLMLDDESEDRVSFQNYRIGKTHAFRQVILEHLGSAPDLSDEAVEQRDRLIADAKIKAKQPKIDSLLKGKGLDPIERAILWNLPSQAIHGTHENLGVYHLKIENDRCFPIALPGSQSLRPHTEIIGIGVRMCGNYLAKQVGNVDEGCFQRLIELEGRLTRLMQSGFSPRMQP